MKFKESSESHVKHIMEYLINEGYADNSKSAYHILNAMSEEWIGSIMESMPQTMRVPKAPFLTKDSKWRRKGRDIGLKPDPQNKNNYDQYNDPGIPRPGA